MITIFFILLQVILLDGILSIDNAAAIGAIASELPRSQQKKALTYGIIGAYVGRGFMLLLAGYLLSHDWVKLIAAAYLIYLCGTHFFNLPPLFNFNFKGLSTFWKTVVIIEIADLAFSIDNVAAVVALSSQIWIIILGVCISILIMRFAAGIFVKLIAWEPSLEHAAFVLIFAIAIELIFKYFQINISEIIQFSISIAILFFFIITGQMARLGGEYYGD